ncbi:ABC transporter ATP-binding protein [Paenibacillus albiflavus]|uniref:ABC transporter ATP-binding protein n=1 Tax=Paenibacillus albiflavus TaxID=2545760 RepID=A0A4R4E819_9BACL|nr:ABC transporter ATP-binding protein [Paenibacillus albiflavus]TCZ75093.1 ABC transporter ATP-binding protein [Paenibacillus albiflavus]
MTTCKVNSLVTESGAVECKELVKRYKQKLVLDQFTASFPEGKITGLLGQNGAGKSTLLKIIAGLTQPDHGEARVFGERTNWKQNQDITILSDRTKWYEHHTVLEAIKFSKVLYPQFSLEKAMELTQFMKLDTDQKVNTLSKGQESRLYLVLCLARNTKLVLLDEPFSGIDLISKEQIIQAIIDYMIESPCTLIISTHEIHETEGLFDHAVFIRNGANVLSGDVEYLRSTQGSIETIYRGIYR